MSANATPMIRGRWRADGGYREMLLISIPLILSTSSWSIQHFVDRMFLTWYSRDAIAAASPAGMLNFTLMSVFVGTAGYVSTFVAQYYGAGLPERIGPAVWQGLYVAAIGGVLIALAAPFAAPIFRLVGHEPSVQACEVDYFQVLCLGAGPSIAASAMSGFFAGRGSTWIVMAVTALSTAVNLVLDYFMIFGKGGFPEMGIKGAAIATVIAGIVSFVAYLALFAWGDYDRRYRILRGWRFDGALFRRLITFGLPTGVQFLLDVAGFTAFLLMLGRLGPTEQAASNIAFSINTLAFMPMVGFGMGVSILVGQYLGRNQPEVAQRCVYSGFHMTFLYMGAIAAAFIIAPHVFLAPFAAGAGKVDFEAMEPLAATLLRFVALYSLFDTMNVIFASALRGAGDTRFVMVMIGCVSLAVLVIPTWIALELLGRGIYAAWVIVTAYVIILGFSFLTRFLYGRWKSMRVIEKAPPAIPPRVPAGPTTEFDF